MSKDDSAMETVEDMLKALHRLSAIKDQQQKYPIKKMSILFAGRKKSLTGSTAKTNNDNNNNNKDNNNINNINDDAAWMSPSAHISRDIAAEIVDSSAHRCGISERLKYRTCLLESNSRGNEECAHQFVDRYPACFFRNHYYHNNINNNNNKNNNNNNNNNNPLQCSSTCISNFDQCLFFSTKPEAMICIQARDKCRTSCPSSVVMPVLQRVKRGYHHMMQERNVCIHKCAAYFEVCEQIIEEYENLYICKENELNCRKMCDHVQG